MNYCIKCESQVDNQKYCDACVELYGLQDKQDTDFWIHVNPHRPYPELKPRLEEIFRDDMKGKTSQIKGTMKNILRKKKV